MAKEKKLSITEQAEHILRSLGLNRSQAELYVALAMYPNSANVNTISSFTNIARTEVYRLLTELHDIGLVEKTILNPLAFRAIPLKEALSTLAEERRKRLDLLAKEAHKLLTRLPKKIETMQVQSSREFVLLPKGKPIVNRIKKAVRASNYRILAITPWRVLTQWMFSSRELWQKALERGVEVRWITGKETPRIDYDTKIANGIPTNPNFKLKSTPETMDTRMGIYDNTEVFIGTSHAKNLAGSPAIWTSNSILVKALTEFFDSKYRQATE